MSNTPPLPTLPDLHITGTTILLAGPTDPSIDNTDLDILAQLTRPNDTIVIVTTTQPATETITALTKHHTNTPLPDVRIVDATSDDQYLSTRVDDIPVVYTPRDLERIVLALSELTTDRPQPDDRRHLVIRSLSPLLTTTPMDTVTAVIDRIAGLRTRPGLGLFGLNYTDHDQATIRTLSAHVDYVLWMDRTADGTIEFDLQPTTTTHPSLSDQ